MIRLPKPLATCALAITAVAVLASNASAVAIGAQQGNGNFRVQGSYSFNCFPGTGSVQNVPFGPFNITPGNCVNLGPLFDPCVPTTGSTITITGCNSGGGAGWVWARATGQAGAGMISKLPGSTVAFPDEVVDSLAISVNRATLGQLTIGVNGLARHLESTNGASTVHRSIMRVTVYQTQADADAGVNAVASGSIFWVGNGLHAARGFFNYSDFVLTDLGNKLQLKARTGLSTVVTGITDVNAAVVVASVDPEFHAVPATTPLTLALIASLLLGGATWFMLRRRTVA